jgi:hypothetical protein
MAIELDLNRLHVGLGIFVWIVAVDLKCTGLHKVLQGTKGKNYLVG